MSPAGFEPVNPSKRVTAELRLRPRGHWDWRRVGTASHIRSIYTRWRWGRLHIPAFYLGRSTTDTLWLGGYLDLSVGVDALGGKKVAITVLCLNRLVPIAELYSPYPSWHSDATSVHEILQTEWVLYIPPVSALHTGWRTKCHTILSSN